MSSYNEIIEPLEVMSLGSWQLIINGSAEIWNNQDNVQKLNCVIKEIYQEILGKLEGICILKAVVFSNEFQNDVYKYQRALGRNEELSSNSNEVFVAGKTLRWGNGNIETTYAIIIHPEEIALGFLSDSKSCRAAFAHELGHVFEGLVLRGLYEIDNRVICVNQWNELVESIAQSTFGEFFAQTIAFPYMSEEDHLGQVMLAAEILSSTTKEMKQEILKYRVSHDMSHLWPTTIRKISFLYAQFGRSLGIARQLSKGDEKELKIVDDFFKALEVIDKNWSKAITQLDEAIDFEEDLNYAQLFSNISETIKVGFDLVGVMPNVSKSLGNDIWIDVPFR